MPGKVLYLSKIVGFKPVDDHACPDLFRVLDIRECFPYSFKKMQQAVFDVFTTVDADKELVSKPCLIELVRFSGWLGTCNFR